ncbi:hypothetical protein GGR57DRAFT_407768 [Xylariaceae sp. FL1272]|nr:hypothetical protein GGR57DRAFT_407768 [Xylariaceae sp. FL1272]
MLSNGPPMDLAESGQVGTEMHYKAFLAKQKNKKDEFDDDMKMVEELIYKTLSKSMAQFSLRSKVKARVLAAISKSKAMFSWTWPKQNKKHKKNQNRKANFRRRLEKRRNERRNAKRKSKTATEATDDDEHESLGGDEHGFLAVIRTSCPTTIRRTSPTTMRRVSPKAMGTSHPRAIRVRPLTRTRLSEVSSVVAQKAMRMEHRITRSDARWIKPPSILSNTCTKKLIRRSFSRETAKRDFGSGI